MKKFSKIILLLLFIALTFTACGGTEQRSEPLVEAPVQQEGGKPVEDAGGADDPGRKSIDNFDLSISVENLDKSDEAMRKIIAENGVLVDSSSVFGDGRYQRYASYTLRVPPDKNANFYEQIKTLGKVESEVQGSQDVTLQHTNYEIRMDSLKKQYTRLVELMDKAEKMEDIIAIEQKVTENITQQEELQAQIDSLNSQVDYINYNIQTREIMTPVTEVNEGFLGKVGNAFQSTFALFINFVQWLILVLIYLLPYLLLGLIILFLYRQYRKKNPKKKIPRENWERYSIGHWRKKETQEKIEKQDSKEEVSKS